MAIVFLFLVVLSLLMVAIRFIFEEKADASDTATGLSAGATSGGPGGGDAADQTDDGVPRWVVATALAYLSEEEREYAPRASGWTIRSTR